MMTQQEIFDKVSSHLLTQNAKSEDDGACLYRSPTGLKCAIGALIPDGLYDPVIENVPIDNIYIEPGTKTLQNILREIGCDANLDFLTDLQAIHDDFNPHEWEERLKILADEYELIFNGVVA